MSVHSCVCLSKNSSYKLKLNHQLVFSDLEQRRIYIHPSIYRFNTSHFLATMLHSPAELQSIAVYHPHRSKGPTLCF